MPAGLDGNPNPIRSPERTAVLEAVADQLLSRRLSAAPMLVGIDGVDGAGKSTFADELTSMLRADGLIVVRSTIDWFHHPRAVRHRRGSGSPVGFYFDSHDLDALRARLLDPFRGGGDGCYRVAAFDEVTDQPLSPPFQRLRGNEVLLFDGIFLHRPELAEYWDFSVFLDGMERVNLKRLGLILADRPECGIELVHHVLEWCGQLDRYSSGMRYYLDLVDPMSHADLVIDNNDLARPQLLAAPGEVQL